MMQKVLLLPAFALLLMGSAPPDPACQELRDALETVRQAALSGDPASAGGLFADDFVIISQSGKVYGREAALFDLGNGFDAWENSDLTIRIEGNTATAVLINRRKRVGMEPASFRVFQLWRNRGMGWRMVAQSSARIRAPEGG